MKRTTRTAEQVHTEEFNKAVGRLLRQRDWRGNWRITDDLLAGRYVTWDFFRHANNGVSAISPVTVNNRQWWVVMSYGYDVDPGMLVLFGLFGGMFTKKKIQLQFWSEDPFSLGKPLADHLNHPDDVTRGWVSTRAQLQALTA